MAILTEVKDPRVRDVTVTAVEVAPDMRTAKVFVSVRGDEKARSLSLRGLQNCAGFLQSLIAKRIDTRYTPRLTFVHDDGVHKSAAVARILEEWRDEAPSESDVDASAGEAEGVDGDDGVAPKSDIPRSSQTPGA